VELRARHRELGGVTLPTAGDDNPFIRYRTLMRAHHVALAGGMSDVEYVDMVAALDERVAKVDGHGFRVTPLAGCPSLARATGVAGVWIKDETGNVAGSHKARHLMGIAIAILVRERLARKPMSPDSSASTNHQRLAIASCGNAALAASVVARAAGRSLDVYVPTWADEKVIARLEELGATLHRCARAADGPPGDPCYHRFREAVRAGALPFTCQGPENGLTIDGGKTLAWELATQLSSEPAPDRLCIQVGGGALASSLIQGLRDAVRMGALTRLPVICPVQSEGGHPLERAWHRITAGIQRRQREEPDAKRATDDELKHAAAHRSEYMWPLEHEPKSVASGILDDETYDWLQIARGMLDTGGSAVVTDDETILRARDEARDATGIQVDATGASGLGGLFTLAKQRQLDAGERALVVLTGVQR